MRDADPIPTLKRQLGELLAGEVRGWRASDVCVLLGTDVKTVSRLRSGDLARLSLEALMRMAANARYEVTLLATKRGRKEPTSP